MARLTSRLISFTTTLCLSAGIHGRLHTKSATSRAFDQVRSEASALHSRPSKATNESSAESASRISQEEIVRFPKIGDVRVCANEDFGKDLRLTFSNEKSGGIIQSYDFGNSYWNWGDDSDGAWHPKLRFKAISIKGFPTPLVVGIAINPGASDSAWQAVAFGVVDGQLQLLTFETMETSDDGGFFFGDLGHGLGLGAAQWDFVWGEDEPHPPPHKYEMKLYKWNERRFEWERVIRTRRQYNSARAALRAYRFKFVDFRGLFPEWADMESW
jgi:hypothetical protein